MSLDVTSNEEGEIQSSTVRNMENTETESNNLSNYCAAPKIRILSPNANSTLSGIVQFRAFSTCIESIERIDFYCDDTLIVSDSTADSDNEFSCSLNTANFSDSSHLLSARAYASGYAIEMMIDIKSVNVLIANYSQPSEGSYTLHTGSFTAQGYTGTGTVAFMKTDANAIYGEIKHNDSTLCLTGNFIGTLSGNNFNNCEGLGQINGTDVQFTISGTMNGNTASGTWQGIGTYVSAEGSWSTSLNSAGASTGAYDGSYQTTLTITEISGTKAQSFADDNEDYVGKTGTLNFSMAGNKMQFITDNFWIAPFSGNSYSTSIYMKIFGDAIEFEINSSFNSGNASGTFYTRFSDGSYVKEMFE